MQTFIHHTAIIDSPCKIGQSTKIWHFCHVSSGVEIGENCILGQNVFIGNNVVLKNNIKVQNNVSIYEGVQCDDNVFIGPSVVFTNVINPRSEINKKTEFKKTIVQQGVTIGANATIICGITLGKYCFIGAGTVVTKSVKDYALIIGNPGVQKGWMSELGNKLYFNEKGIAICADTNCEYTLINNIVAKTP